MIDRFSHRPTVTLCLGLALLAPSMLRAQRATFGVLGGVNSSKAYIERDGEDLNTDRRTGWMAGGYAEFGVGKRVSIRPELLVTEQGGETSGGGESSSLALRYVQIPVLARVDIGESGSIRPFLMAGPALSLRIGCELKFSGTILTETVDWDTLQNDSPDPFTKTAVSGVIGGGIDFGRWALGVRYDTASRTLPRRRSARMARATSSAPSACSPACGSAETSGWGCVRQRALAPPTGPSRMRPARPPGIGSRAVLRAVLVFARGADC
jgi:hypothetical protein